MDRQRMEREKISPKSDPKDGREVGPSAKKLRSRGDMIPPKADTVNNQTALGEFLMAKKKHAADCMLARAREYLSGKGSDRQITRSNGLSERSLLG